MSKPPKDDKVKATTTEVETIAPKTTALAAPSFMKSDAGLGTEGLDHRDLEIPRVKLIQAISDEVSKFQVPAGDWFHTVAEESLGVEVPFIPLKVWNSVTLWRPRSDGGGILARSDDGKRWDRPDQDFSVRLKNNKVVTYNTGKDVAASGLTAFGTSDPGDQNSMPAATKSQNFLIWLIDNPEMSPALISFQRSSEKVGRRFASKIKMAASSIPIFGKTYTLVSDTAAGPEGNYLVPRVLDGAFVQDEALYKHLRDLHVAFSDKTVRGVGGESDDPDARGDGAGDEEAAGRKAY